MVNGGRWRQVWFNMRIMFAFLGRLLHLRDSCWTCLDIVGADRVWNLGLG